MSDSSPTPQSSWTQRSISVVIPVYNSEPMLDELVQRIGTVLADAQSHEMRMINLGGQRFYQRLGYRAETVDSVLHCWLT